MKIALHAEHVSMSVRLKLSLKATSTRSMLIFAPIVVLVLMFARLRLFILQNNTIFKKTEEAVSKGEDSLFCFNEDYISLSREVPGHQYYP